MGRGDSTHRTTIDIDLAAYRRARGVLGTRGYKDTVNEALKAVERTARLRAAADAIRAGDLDIVSPEELSQLRQSRV